MMDDTDRKVLYEDIQKLIDENPPYTREELSKSFMGRLILNVLSPLAPKTDHVEKNPPTFED